MSANKPALWIAASRGESEEVLRLLLLDADIEEKGGIDESTPLVQAATEGHKKVALALLEHGADVSAQNIYGDTALHEAVFHDSFTEVVSMLLQLGAVVSVQNNSGWTPLSLATGDGHQNVVGLLIQHGALVSEEDKNGMTPLHHAANSDRIRVVESLIEHGADVSVRDKQGKTPLWHAAGKRRKYPTRDMGMVQTLLDKGADINTRSFRSKDDVIYTPLMAAAYMGEPFLVQHLLKQGADVTPEDLASVEARKRTFHGTHETKEDRKVASLLRTALKKRRVLLHAAEETRRGKCMAFAMTQHERLGVGSLFSTLPPEIMQTVLFLV